MFHTRHHLHFVSSEQMNDYISRPVHLVVTSPPYPMISMWDQQFREWEPRIGEHLDSGGGMEAWELMHRCLDRVWDQCAGIVAPGGFVCINIGDAVRSIDDRFRLFSNHSRITSSFIELGLDPLPVILWRKSTNAPNKFMGSGMLPAGAYVTLEHEYILIFRKGGKREFSSPEEKRRRRESAIFWEERNRWYSDTWQLAGELQEIDRKKGDRKQPAPDLSGLRRRSGAFPWELAYRLILMYSAAGDYVVDPFLGTGSTAAAAIAAGRNSIGFEIEPGFREIIIPRLMLMKEELNARIHMRLEEHSLFTDEHRSRGNELKKNHSRYRFAVKTGQETDMVFRLISRMEQPEEYLLKTYYSEWDDSEPSDFQD